VLAVEVKVLVTGGTGTLGRHVVQRLRQSGHHVRILSRKQHAEVNTVLGDLKTGTGLEVAVAGCHAIIHAATGFRQSLSSRATDVDGTRRLLEVARREDIKHLVYVSIVGIEGVDFPYYRTKVAAEALVREGNIPWTILRATQFHDLMEVYLGAFTLLPGLAFIPFDWQFQPVDASEVAQRLAAVVLAQPSGTHEDFGGPQVRDFKSIAQAWLSARKLKRRMANLRLPFKFSRQFAEGGLLAGGHRQGTITFERWLAQKYRSM